MALLQAPTASAAFERHGFNVRGTFIDGPAHWFDVAGAARRARSAPPAAEDSPRAEPSALGTRRPILPVPLECGKLAERCVARGRCSSADSDASTDVGTPPSSSYCDSSPLSDLSSSPDLPSPTAGSSPSRRSRAAESADLQERGRLLAELVERHCGFMRLNGYVLQEHSGDKVSKRGTALTVRFYVRGLPPAKRAKWQHPLGWAAKGVLSGLGCDAEVVGGELRVPCQEGTFIRIDFAPGRL